MKILNNNTENRVIVAFHVGRGGSFNNPGFHTFIGEMNFQELISLRSEYLFESNRDEKGKFCKKYLTDPSGNFITDDDLKGLVGGLNFDNDYDRDFCDYVDNLPDFLIEKIAQSIEFKSGILIGWLEELTSYKFDSYGSIIESEEE